MNRNSNINWRRATPAKKSIWLLMRGDQRIAESLELAAKLPPYIHPFLGILPLRDAAADETKGVTVRYVYPDSPAAKAGIEIGDRIVSLAGTSITSPQNLQEQLAALEPLETVKLEIDRNGKTQTVQATLATLPEAVPANLPPAHKSKPAGRRSAHRAGQNHDQDSRSPQRLPGLHSRALQLARAARPGRVAASGRRFQGR